MHGTTDKHRVSGRRGTVAVAAHPMIDRRGALACGVIAALMLAVALPAARAQFIEKPEAALSPPGVITSYPSTPHPNMPICVYPIGSPGKLDRVQGLAGRVLTIIEEEPNDTPNEAQFLPISSEIGNEVDANVRGLIRPGADVDFYRFSARRGDIIGIAVDSLEVEIWPGLFTFQFFFQSAFFTTPVGVLDPVVGIYDISGVRFFENDDDFFITTNYPRQSPFPSATLATDSALTWVAPDDGDYLIRVSSFASASSGEYEMRVRIRRPYLETQPAPARQIVFLDFNGVPSLNARLTFGAGRFDTPISPLRQFLGRWGLTLLDEADVVQAIIDVVERNFDDLRRGDLAGDREFDGIDGSFDIEFLNSRDHADPWGQPNVSRVIVGGTIAQLGISTIGITESIDPGNFNTEETAIVLLDELSGPPLVPFIACEDEDENIVACCFNPDPEGEPMVPCCVPDDDNECDDPEDATVPVLVPNPLTLNAIPLGPNATMIDLIGEAVGNIVSHEIGHYLGLWHTDRFNDTHCLIDTGGDLPRYAGVGPDGIFGTADDVRLRFVPDEFDPFEGVGDGIQLTDVRAAHALSTGTMPPLPTPPPPTPDPPLASIRAEPTVGQAPLTVRFAGGGVDPRGEPFTRFEWDFDDGTTATGLSVEHTFVQPATYTVNLTARTASGGVAFSNVRIVVTAGDGRNPTASLTASPRSGPAPLTVLFQGAGSDPEGATVTYHWNFGDGSNGTGPITQHTYVNPGTYGVTLTVRNPAGRSGVAVTSITVTGEGGGAQRALGLGGDNGVPLNGMQCGAGAAGAAAVAMAALLCCLPLLRRRRH